MLSNQMRMRMMNLFTGGISSWINQEKNHTCLIMGNIFWKKIKDCFEQHYSNLFGKDANININSDESDHLLFHVACLLNCKVWQNSGEAEQESCYGETCYFALWGDGNLSINNWRWNCWELLINCMVWTFKYFKLTGIGLYDFWAKIIGLKYDNAQWNPTLFIIEICMCAPISNALLERLFNQINFLKSNVWNGFTKSVFAVSLLKPYVVMHYHCSFSSLILFWLVFIFSSRFFLKRKEFSCATVVSMTKKENEGFIQAFLAFICPRLKSKLHLFLLTSTLKTPTYPPDPISKSVLFPLTLASIIWSIIWNWSKEELTANLTAGRKKITKRYVRLWKQKLFQDIYQYKKTTSKFTAFIIGYRNYNSSGVSRTSQHLRTCFW